jgi:2-amino-4-hydroxy-6-hydroxymethyldihydropteridine diphosphokinase
MTKNKINYAYLGIGSNLADKKKNILLALELIESEIGSVIKESKTFKSKAIGFETKNDFHNIAIKVKTKLNPFELLEIIEDIERTIGRTKKSTNRVFVDRIIDIDILYYNDLILDTEKLIIPHPENKNRLFVLKPLSEISADLFDPSEQKTIQTMMENLVFE